MAYVDRFGRHDHAAAFICQEGGCDCLYRVKYTRGVVEKGDIWGKLAELQIDKVAAQKAILKKKLEEEDIPNALRTELIDELGGIRERWGSHRSENVERGKCPC